MSRFKPVATTLRVGQRVEVSPACDGFIRGIRYGTVVVIGSQHVHVQWDRTGKVGAVRPDYLTLI